MDINSIRDQVSNLTLYDLKAGVRKVQNGTKRLVTGSFILQSTDDNQQLS